MPRVNRLAALPKRKATFISPMDCAPVSKVPDGGQWLFEIKLDGYRAIAVKADGRVNLFSRRHKSFNHQYPHLVEALGELPEGTVVDGEVVALDESGRPNFNLLQNFRSEAQHIHYFIFDLLIWQDRDLTRLPLSERRELVKSFLKLRSGYNACRTSTASVTQPALVIERMKFFLRLNTRRPSARFFVASIWAIGHAIVRVSSCFPVWRATGVTSVILIRQNRLHKIEGFHNE